MGRIISKHVHPDESIPEELLLKVYCCREWLILSINSWGRCKICGNRPVRD